MAKDFYKVLKLNFVLYKVLCTLYFNVIYFKNQASISRWPPVTSEAHASVDDEGTAGVHAKEN